MPHRDPETGKFVASDEGATLTLEELESYDTEWTALKAEMRFQVDPENEGSGTNYTSRVTATGKVPDMGRNSVAELAVLYPMDQFVGRVENYPENSTSVRYSSNLEFGGDFGTADEPVDITYYRGEGNYDDARDPSIKSSSDEVHRATTSSHFGAKTAGGGGHTTGNLGNMINFRRDLGRGPIVYGSESPHFRFQGAVRWDPQAWKGGDGVTDFLLDSDPADFSVATRWLMFVDKYDPDDVKYSDVMG